MIKENATNRHSSEAFMFTCHCCSKCTGLSSQGQVTAKTANSIQGSHWKKNSLFHMSQPCYQEQEKTL